MTVKVAVPGAGKLSASAQARGKEVAVAKARAVQAGTAAVRLRFTAKGRKALKRAHKAALTIVVKFTPQGGAPEKTTAKVTLKR